MKKIQILALGLFGIVYMSTLSGCVILGAGLAAGYVGYELGALVAEIGEPVDVVYKATLAALNEMQTPVVAQHLEKHESKVHFKSLLENEKSSIITTALTEHSSKVVIRVGLFGDDIAAQKILDVIKNNL